MDWNQIRQLLSLSLFNFRLLIGFTLLISFGSSTPFRRKSSITGRRTPFFGGYDAGKLNHWCLERALFQKTVCETELRRWCNWTPDRASFSHCQNYILHSVDDDNGDKDKTQSGSGRKRTIIIGTPTAKDLPPSDSSLIQSAPKIVAQAINSTRLHQLQQTISHRIRATLPLRDKFVDNAGGIGGGFERDPSAKVQINELLINQGADFWDGDILLSEEQANIIAEELLLSAAGNRTSAERQNLLLGGPRRKRVHKRKVAQLPYFLWSKLPIDYSIVSNVPAKTQQMIHEVISGIQNHTCVRFRFIDPQKPDPSPRSDRLLFKNGLGCSSFVGRMSGVQEVSLQSPGCAQPGIIGHEIGHALGLFHEQGRPDQKEYIRVDFDNINNLHWSNFIPQDSNFVNYWEQPYDLGSVMHYGPYGFAVNTVRPSIFTKDKNYQSTIGQRVGLSFIDYAQINRAYCSSMCAALPCVNGGYPDPNNCKRCLCPPGFGGRLCDAVEVTPSKCGGVLDAYLAPETIASPNYPEQVPEGTNCVWMIKTEPGKNVSMQLVGSFGFECKTVCDANFIEFKYGTDFRQTGPRFCCYQRPTQRLISRTHMAIVIMRTGRNNLYHNKGFKLRYWSEGRRFEGRGSAPVIAGEKLPTTQAPAAVITKRRTRPPSVVITKRLPTTTTTTTITEVKKTISTKRRLKTAKPTIIPSLSVTPKPPHTKSLKPFQTLAPFLPVINIPTDLPSNLGTPIPISATTTTTRINRKKTEPPDPGCSCSSWSSWNRCSQRCGGCGTQTRRRSCNRLSPKCFDLEKRKCNFRACRGNPFLVENGEFHLVFDGCCFGLLQSRLGLCSNLTGVFNEVISSFISV